MAKKSRTPDPPRKVQAPKVRQKSQAETSGVSVPGANIMIGIGIVAIAGLVIALFLVLSSGKAAPNVTRAEVTKVRTAMAAAGCTFVGSSGGISQEHMSTPDQHVRYATFPAASGVHNPTPANWGNYRFPADPRQVVHNLEHGGIAIWYGKQISPADRGALDAFYDQSPNGIIITPLEDPYPGVTYPKHDPLGSKIGLSVWTQNNDTGKGTVYVSMCPRYDARAFTAFRDAFRGKGPERYPLSQMAPGA